MVPGWILFSLLGVLWYFKTPKNKDKIKDGRGYQMTLEEKEELIIRLEEISGQTIACIFLKEAQEIEETDQIKKITDFIYLFSGSPRILINWIKDFDNLKAVLLPEDWVNWGITKGNMPAIAES